MSTARQADLLTFLRRRAMQNDVSPSFEEMREHLGLKSKEGIGRLVSALHAAGAVVRVRDRARAIRVTGIDDYARGYRDGQRDARAEAVPVRRYEGLEADVIGDLSLVLGA